MRSEDLYISDKAVRVKYVFMNTSPKDVTVTVAFPMPDIAWDAVGEANVDIPAAGPNFLAFTTAVDGKPVKAQVEQKAVDQNGVDRTAYLLGIGVPLDNTRVQTTDDALNRLPKAQQDTVVKLGLAAWPDEGIGVPHKLSARWTLKTTFFWQQTFPAGRAVAVEHNYTPSLGQGYDIGWGAWRSPVTAEFLTKKFCIDDSFVAAFQKTRASDSKIPFGEEFIDYVLVTGANWKAPIGDFHMVIDKGAPANLVSFCGTGVRKTGPTTFEVHYTNFTPTSNVSVLILNSNWRFPDAGVPVALSKAPESLPPEVQSEIDKDSKSCSDKVTFAKGFMTRRDINGDGIEDFILDYGHFLCGEMSGYYCGSAGCLTQVFVSLSDGKFAKVLDENVRGIKFTTLHGRPAMLLGLHGSACGRIGLHRATSRYIGMEKNSLLQTNA